MAGASDSKKWESVQKKLADIPGHEGARLRRERYAPYFLRFGKDVNIDEGCRFSHPDRIALEDDVRINVGGLFYGSGGIHIGRHARIGPRCFIHSANHEISSVDKAFFESGYNYEAVRLGDNCLVSANASILPGANLGGGSFVGCGAVVIRGNYGDEARLVGVPARDIGSSQDEAFEGASSIAIVCQNTRYEEAGKLLIERLGLPQVRVVAPSSLLADSVHTVLCFGAEGWSPEIRGSVETKWRFAKNGEKTFRDITIASGRGDTTPFPFLKKYHLAPRPIGENPLRDACRMTLYYCIKRARKRDLSPVGPELVEALTFRHFLKSLPGESADSLREETEFLEGKPKLSLDSDQIFRLIRRYKNKTLFETLKSEIYKARKIVKRAPKEEYTIKDFTLEPEIYFLKLYYGKKGSIDFFTNKLRDNIHKINKARLLSFLALGLFFLNDSFWKEIVRKILSAEFYDEKSGCIKNGPKTDSFCYSPVLAIVLLLYQSEGGSDSIPKIYQEVEETFSWNLFSSSKRDDQVIRLEDLVSFETAEISESLLENWLNTLRVPSFQGGQYELEACAYRPLGRILEELWLNLFAKIQIGQGEPLFQLTPWPFGYHAAISLRYDVDRSASSSQIKRILKIQRERLNGACGSWYFIPGLALNERIKNHVGLYLQEAAVHATALGQSVAGEGTTYHSGPGACYWGGRPTVEDLEQGKAAYGENLFCQSAVPGSVWLNGESEGRRSKEWLVPTHFPLEGSTSDESLEYFDQLKDPFEELLRLGGQVIIGSHPDLNQDILEDLLKRLNGWKIWPVTVEGAVDRCKRLFSYGAVTCVRVPGKEGYFLRAQKTVGDVGVRIYDAKDCEGHEQVNCQLLAHKNVPIAYSCLPAMLCSADEMGQSPNRRRLKTTWAGSIAKFFEEFL